MSLYGLLLFGENDVSVAPLYRGKGTTAGSSSAIAPGLPSGTVAGDLLIMFLITAAQAITVSGWTEAPSSPQETGGIRLTIFYKIAVGGDATTTSDSGTGQIGVIIGIKAGSFNAAAPFDTSAGNTQTSTTNISVTGSTTTVDDCFVIVASVGDTVNAGPASSWVNSGLTGITNITSFNSSSIAGGLNAGFAYGVRVDAGDYGATTNTASIADVRANISLAIAPA